MPAHTPPGPPVFEPADRIPALAALRSAVRRQDWTAVAASFDVLPDEDDRALACRVVAETLGAEDFLRRTAERLPHDPLPRTLLADRLVQIGWGIRTGHRAQHVSQRQFDDFHAHLRRAEILLIDVCAEHPQYALAWYLRVITSRGLELGPGETRRRYDRLAEHHPHHYSGQAQLLQQLCPKWGGSWEAAHGFARECAAKAPDGSPNGALVAIAQLENYLEISERTSTGAASAYLRDLDNQTRRLEAAAQSVLHPASRRDAFRTVDAHSAFAAAHSAAARHAAAAPHFRALGDRASEFPWGYLGSGDHENEFERHRKIALAKG
ncbi:hypothetical protein [Streptomyces sp. NRRL S-378]|uniref:hypothetical protein n=1 Tax=Streptomyces sp. NRRL S-378 TaxID=1463904 RepID=UPI0004C7FB1E|nr:hypothetical protein [Streptomyces sp. NRRL S-378]